MSYEVKTLADILAEMGEPVSANPALTPSQSTKAEKKADWTNAKKPKNLNPKDVIEQDLQTDAWHNVLIKEDGFLVGKPKDEGLPPARQQTIGKAVAGQTAGALDSHANKQTALTTITNTDVHQAVWKALSDTPYESIMGEEDRAVRYLRWLAFYYLSRREHSRYELQQKLLAKGCEPQAINALLVEFAEKDYQSDERCAYMIIRESVRKNRGRAHIREALKRARLDLPYSLDELIEQAGVSVLDESEAEAVDWLKLAVEARTKKYGGDIPSTPKDKAKQLRFLQYRGFEMSVCFDALKMTMADFE